MRCLILACTGTSIQSEHETLSTCRKQERCYTESDMNECTVLRLECSVGRTWNHMTDVTHMSPEVFYVWGITTSSRLKAFLAHAPREFSLTLYIGNFMLVCILCKSSCMIQRTCVCVCVCVCVVRFMQRILEM